MAGPTPDKISPDEFGEILDRYTPLIQSISKIKGGKSGLKPCRSASHGLRHTFHVSLKLYS
jgi:hypothetical protein